MTITSKVAVVTGAGRGIGRAVAARLAKDGFHVVAADLDAQGAQECAEAVWDSDGLAEALVLDVTDRTAVRAAFADIHQRLGRIDALVNNAMWIKYGPLVDFDEDAVDAMFGIGVKSSIWTMQAVIPVMKAQGGGVIVNLSSPAAIRSVPGGALYSAVKGAVTSLTLQSAGELGRDGIRVNAVMPGSVPTEGARAVVDDSGFELRKTRTPVGRLGRPEDIAAAIAFLVSPDAGFVTGHVLAADGGFSVT